MRCFLPRLAVLALCVPAPLAAQRITLSAGTGFGVTMESELRTNATLGISSRDTRERTEAGFVVALGFALPLADRFELMVEAARQGTGKVEVTHREPGSGETTARFYGNAQTIWQAKLGLGYRLQTAIPLTVTAGPALLRYDPPDPNEIIEREAYYNWGMHASASVDLPINDFAAFHLALDDVLVFWNDEVREAQLEDRYRETTGLDLIADLDTAASHFASLRAGFSFRL